MVASRYQRDFKMKLNSIFRFRCVQPVQLFRADLPWPASVPHDAEPVSNAKATATSEQPRYATVEQSRPTAQQSRATVALWSRQSSTNEPFQSKLCFRGESGFFDLDILTTMYSHAPKTGRPVWQPDRFMSGFRIVRISDVRFTSGCPVQISH